MDKFSCLLYTIQPIAGQGYKYGQNNCILANAIFTENEARGGNFLCNEKILIDIL